jgi:hypothetical protein
VAEEPLADQKRQDLPAEDLGQPRVVQTRQPVESSYPVHSSLGDQKMQVRVEVDPVAEGLDGDDDAGNERLARQRLKIDREGLDRRPAKLPQEPAPVLEEDPQRLGDRQHHLAVRHAKKQGLPHPLAPLLPALGVAGGAEAAGLAGERQQMFTVAVRAADPGEARARIAAVEIALDDLPDDRPEMAALIRFATEDCKACTPSRSGFRRQSGTGRNYGTTPDRGPCAPDDEGGRFPAHRES